MLRWARFPHFRYGWVRPRMLGTCFACKVVHEQYSLTSFVSTVHCQMHTLWMTITNVREH